MAHYAAWTDNHIKLACLSYFPGVADPPAIGLLGQQPGSLGGQRPAEQAEHPGLAGRQPLCHRRQPAARDRQLETYPVTTLTLLPGGAPGSRLLIQARP
jgi:hypothetical protein